MSSGPNQKYVVAEFFNGSITESGLNKISFGLDVVGHESTELTADVGVMKYVGQRSTSTSSNTVLCVWDEEENKYVPVKVDLYKMIPKVFLSKGPNPSMADSAKNGEDYRAATSLFGSNKSKRAVKEMEKRKDIRTEHVENLNKSINVLVENFTDTVAAQPGENDDKPDDFLSVLPPRNKDATSVDEIYDFKEIVSGKVVKLLEKNVPDFKNFINQTLNATKSEESADNDVYISHFIDSVIRADMTTSEEGSSVNLNTEKLSILLYWYYLFTFYKKTAKRHVTSIDSVKRMLADEMPSKMLKNLTQVFTINGAVNQVTRTKTLSYLCTVALLVNSYSIELGPLLADFKIDKDQIKTMFSHIGCKLANTSNSGDSSALGKKSRKRNRADDDDSLLMNSKSKVLAVLSLKKRAN